MFMSFIQAKRVVITGGVHALKRNQKQWFKVALQLGMRYWFKTFIRGHFRNTARQKYNYQPRSSKYLKSRIKRGKGPLVKTGATKRAVTTFIQTTGTAKSAKGTMNAPWWIREVPMKGGPVMAFEITAITVAEQKQIDRIVAKRFAELINSDKGKITIRI